MGDKKEIRKLQQETQELKDELLKTRTIIKNLEESRSKLLQKKNEDTVQIENLKAKIRDQNEADLLMVSLQMVIRILQGEKKPSLQDAVQAQNQLWIQSGIPWPHGIHDVRTKMDGMLNALFR